MRFRAHEVASATNGRLHGPDVEIDGVSFDSRSLQPGQLFVPLVADRDGHEFIQAALARGAAAFLTQLPPTAAALAGGATAIEVPDTLRALMAVAASQRQQFHGPVIGVTGSVGKTSTKDLAWAALAASRRTWANERSFNNEQGLPTTLLNTPPGIEVLMLEMGMRGLGEIAELCAIARPTIGVVTRVAEAHSDRVGGIEGVARAKAELIECLPADGCAILNADDARVKAMAEVSAAPVLLYGEGADADVRISGLQLDEIARPTFRLDTPWGHTIVHLGTSGRHMAHNAAAALACAGAVGADLAEGAAALADVGLTAMRMEVLRTASGATVLNDSYNANPTSMRAALDALADLPATRRVAVLGLMAEISDAEAEHLAIVEYAHGHHIDVIPYGTGLYGLPPVADPVAALGLLAGGDAVLVKGSRVVGLERVAAALLGQ
ncbi:MAG: UDP-N-acetylmuramoyl-tripeptide--D-alanyl-D-alanine ligase [Actinomycetota bacterium]|nr:UDP-N-acetylmuramoyl-tripeptide--D-alanyl-D-alanine ligase [Actinomycetota bacterium]